VIPGLNDTHNHTMQAGEAAVLVKLDDVKSVAEALQRIKDAAAKKKPGEWIIGDSWHPTAQLKEQRYLTAAEIDTVALNNPVRLGDGHISSYNTAAMKFGGVDRNTPNPEGGVIEKDASGNPNGVPPAGARPAAADAGAQTDPALLGHVQPATDRARGIHRRQPSCRHFLLRPCIQRAKAFVSRIQLRASDARPASAGTHACAQGGFDISALTGRVL